MLVKKLDLTKYDEAVTASQIRSIGFHHSERHEELLQRISEFKQKDVPLSDPADSDPPLTAWGVFADDKLIAVASAIDFYMRYENQNVRMSGIQGVATLPEYRRKGAVRRLLKDMLHADHDSGSIFSYLYPFSYAYYQQFGYGYGSRRVRTVIPIGLLREFKAKGRVRFAQPDDLPAIEEIYTRFIADTNGPICRGKDNWSFLWEKDPFLSGILSYVWYDESNLPGAYIVLQDRAETDSSGNRKLLVRDWGCRCLDDLKAIFAFLNNFASEYAAVEILLPMHFQAENIFGEIVSLSRKLETIGQVRLLNVQSALAMKNKPLFLPDYSFSLRVVDDFIPANSGVYIVETSAKENCVSFRPDNKDDFDLKLDISALSTLLYGSDSIDELYRAGRIEYSDKMDNKTREYLSFYFRGQNTAIYDYF